MTDAPHPSIALIPIADPHLSQQLVVVQQLAHKIWHQHYTPIIGAAQVAYMLQKMYDTNALEQQVAQGHKFFMIGINDVPHAGFASINSLDADGQFFINKLYIDPIYQAAGAGTQVISQLIGQMSGVRALRLTVNRQNFKAINFYFKNGFIIEKTADFDIGDNYFMNDFVMLRNFQN
jgi:ribosomal protein S18 acetylase RimI-like enzyme